MSATTAGPLEERGAFMFEHAGYSYGPDETPEEGRRRCALELAAIDEKLRAAIDVGTARIRWETDQDPDLSWADAETLEKIDGGTWTVDGCILETACPACGSWDVRASLWGIVGPSDDPYREVVAAELAQESAEHLTAPAEVV